MRQTTLFRNASNAICVAAISGLAIAANAQAQAQSVEMSRPARDKPAQAEPSLVSQTSGQPLTLEALQRAAVARDARNAQRDYFGRSTKLQIEGLTMTHRPQFNFSALNAHASDVTHLDISLPAGKAPIPPKDRWSVAADITQVLYDGGLVSSRKTIERARLAENVASLDVTLEPLRDEVAQTFFAVVLLQASEQELELMTQDLEQLLADTRARVREGAALGRDSAAVKAEWRGAQAKLGELRSQRRAAIASLTQVTGIPITTDTPLSLPEWASRLNELADITALRARPEFTRIALTRERLNAEQSAADRENRPRVVAFGTAGSGRPGLNQFNPDVAAYWQFGVKLEWSPFTWNSASRNRELISLQQQTTLTEERALADRLARAVQGDLAERERLRSQITDDEEVIALRALALEQGEAQGKEGVITGAEVVSLRTSLAEARLTRERHRVQLAQAEVRIATTLGLTPR